MNPYRYLLIAALSSLASCKNIQEPTPSAACPPPPSQQSAALLCAPGLSYPPLPKNIAAFQVVDRNAYLARLQGFWLGESLANWTGLITEMDKVTAPFYTAADWGKPDQKNMWGGYVPHASRIDFYAVKGGEPWGADDDTDMEYLYQHLLEKHQTSVLTPVQIREGWLQHIYTNEDAPFYQKFAKDKPQRENFLWVSNESAHILMQKGMLPPATSEPENNPDYAMIDAQLTTEIFGLFAPTRADIALKMAHLPIRATAKNESEWIAEFYVIMYSLSASVDKTLPPSAQMMWLAEQASQVLPANSYPAKMYEFVKHAYEANPDKTHWEKTRDEVYQYYQASSHDGYVYKMPFDAGINFASSLISLFYGGGDIARTTKIGSLAGWDSDNPTATWGGLLGSLLGKQGIEAAFGQTDLSDAYWIHRTRRNFVDLTPNTSGEDTFTLMAQRGVQIVDRVVVEEMGGYVDLAHNRWLIPKLAKK